MLLSVNSSLAEQFLNRNFGHKLLKKIYIGAVTCNKQRKKERKRKLKFSDKRIEE
jgi:hypothetical protein